MRPLLDDGGVAALADAAAAADRANPKYARVSADVMAFLHQRLLNSPAAALRTMGEELVTAADETDELRATGVPVLVAHGATDDAWPPEEQRRMAERLGASYVSIAGSVHSPACEAPEATSTRCSGSGPGSTAEAGRSVLDATAAVDDVVAPTRTGVAAVWPTTDTDVPAVDSDVLLRPRIGPHVRLRS